MNEALNNKDTSKDGKDLFLDTMKHISNSDISSHSLLSQANTNYEQNTSNVTHSSALEDKVTLKTEHNHIFLTTQSLIRDGRLLRDHGEFEEARTKFMSALQMARNIENLDLEVDALNLQASIFGITGDDNLALDYLDQALKISQQENLEEKSANILTNMGKINLKLGDYSSALENTKHAYSIYERFAPQSYSAAFNLVDIGNIYRNIGDFEDAKHFYEKAQIIGEKTNDFTVKVIVLNNLGTIACHFKQYQLALNLYNEALALCRERKNKQFEIDNLDGLGQVYVINGEFEKAILVHSEALSVSQELGEQEAEAKAFLSLGRDYFKLQEFNLAISNLIEALNIAKSCAYRKTIFEIHKLLSVIYAKQDDFANAYFHHQEYHKVEKEVFNEKSEETTRQLTVKFDLERARFEAQEYRLSSEVAERAAKEAEKIVQIRTRELEGAQLEVVMRLAQAAELRDEDTGEHTFRVGRNAAAIAYCLGWSEAEVKILYLAARLHDVGKIGISDTILLKPGKLTDDEFELMRQHTVIGAKMLSNGQSALLRMAERIALSHHERWDGNGYPNKLSGEAIPDVARIVSVADVLDALTHARPYKKAWSVEETLAEIERNSGRQFDPNIVRIAIKVFSGDNCLSPVAKPSDWEETFKELQDLFGMSRFSM